MIDQFEGKVIAEKYRVDSLIREGSSGDLYSARHIMMDKPVMLKILAPALAIDPRYVKKFTDEAKFASAVSHPNVLNIIDFGTDSNGVEYTVFDGVEGESLKEAMRRDGQFTVERSVRIAREIAAAVSAGHAKGMIHSDLEPQNIFLNKSDDGKEVVKVYGLGALTELKHAMPQYLAPEQSQKPPVADARSNIYSLGVLLYQMLAGELPFTSETREEILEKQNHELPAPLSAFRHDTPDDLEPMIISAMSKDPDHRYQTMDAFAEDLTLVSMGVPSPVKAAAAAASAGPIQKRSIWQTATIVLAGILILGVALIYSTASKGTDPTTELVEMDAGSLPVQPINPATGAQEDNLSKLPEMTQAEIMAAQANNANSAVELPGGDGFNPWAKGVMPPAGAPLPQTVTPGQTYTIDPNGGSPFMPNESGIVLVPVPVNANTAAKPAPSPKTGATNANLANTVVTKPTPKPMATPPVAATSPTPQTTKPAAAKTPVKKPGEEEKN